MPTSTPERKIILGGSEDFRTFLATQNSHDRNSLRVYWKLACRKHSLLVIRAAGPRMGHILIMPIDRLPNIEQHLKHCRYYLGCIFARLPKFSCHIFGEAIKSPQQSEISAEVAPKIETKSLIPPDALLNRPPPKKRGRPRGPARKVRDSVRTSNLTKVS